VDPEELSIAKRKITGRVAEAGGGDGLSVWRTDSLRGERKEGRVEIQGFGVKSRAWL